MAKPAALGLLLWAIPALAVIATVNSPCLSICGGTQKTVDDELICNDGDYNSTVKGLTMKNCLLCESTSTTYSNQFDSDLYWFICRLSLESHPHTSQRHVLMIWRSQPEIHHPSLRL